MSRPERLRFRHLTKIERFIVCNGCGPKALFMKVPDFVFREACDHHDFNYWIGCTKAQRKKADRQFLDEMLCEANDNFWYKMWARAYYRAVRLGGGACFHYAQNQRTKSDLKALVLVYALEHVAHQRELGVKK